MSHAHILSNKVDKHMLTYTTAIKQSPSGRDYQWPPQLRFQLSSWVYCPSFVNYGLGFVEEQKILQDLSKLVYVLTNAKSVNSPNHK